MDSRLKTAGMTEESTEGPVPWPNAPAPRRLGSRDERRKALKIEHRIRSPRVAALFRRRIEGRLVRKSTVPAGA